MFIMQVPFCSVCDLEEGCFVYLDYKYSIVRNVNIHQFFNEECYVCKQK